MVYSILNESDASTKIKSIDFTSGNQFTLGIPISAVCKDKYSMIAYIAKSSWIYCMLFFINDGTNFSIMNNVSCIVYYI